MGFAYNSAFFQVILVSLVCFCCPGMFNVLNSIGAGGLVTDKNASKQANIALNVTFSIFGVLGGGIVNLVGPKWSLALSGLGYVFYGSSYLIFDATKSGWVIIFAGALLGACAGILWTAQGQIMMAYATERTKGKYISIFWIIFNLGAVLGSIIPFALNYNSEAGSLSNGTYIGLIIVMAVGCSIGLFLCPIDKVVREDGSPVQISPFENVLSESVEVLKVFTNWKMLALIPLFVSSNWFYTYQFDLFNAVIFNIRTRAFNNIWYWAMQMVGAYVMGYLLDYPGLARSKRGLYGLLTLAGFFTIVWAGGLAFQLQYSKEVNPFKPTDDSGVDFKDSIYAGLCFLYMFYGMLDAMLQTLAYWVMGSLSNNAQILARYAGFYKGIQSAGGAIAWSISTTEVSYLTQLIICWVLLEVAIPGTYLVIRTITDFGEEEQGVSKNEIDLDTKA